MSHLHERVSALIDGELSPSARARALRHAQGCALCRRDIQETLEVKRRLNRLTAADIPGDLRQLVAPVPPVGDATQGGVDDIGFGPAIRRVAVSLGSVTVFVFVLAYLVGVPDGSSPRPVSPPVNELAVEFTDGASSVGGDPTIDTSPTLTRTVTSSVGYRNATGHTTGTIVDALGDDPQAVALLRKAVLAADHVPYAGVMVCRSSLLHGGEWFSVEVSHVPGQGTAYRIRSHRPAARSAVFQRSGPAHDAQELAALSALVSSYDIGIDGTQRLLGRPVTVVSASHDGRVDARFWVDDSTDLLLWRELYADGHVVRESGYRSLHIKRRHGFGHLPQQMVPPHTTRLPTQVAAVLSDKGWAYPQRLASGFRLRSLQDVDTDGGIVGGVYSDGLSTILLYEQRGALDPRSLSGFRAARIGGREVYVRDGMPMEVVWQAGTIVVTVVSDLPEQDLAPVVRKFPDLESTAPSPGLTGRVEKGFTRLVSAVVP